MPVSSPTLFTGTLDNDTPPVLKATAGIAWLVFAYSLLCASPAFLDPASSTIDARFLVGLAGGSAYLALMLPRRVTSAWKTCRSIAAVSGTVNMVVLPALLMLWGFGITLGYSFGVEVAHAEWVRILASAAAATALPWAFYFALDDPRVRSWFCLADCEITP